MKKLLKLTLCLIGIASVAAGIYYYLTKKKHSLTPQEEPSDEEDDSTDFLDLSNLKFSRHYVDLR